MTTKRQRAVAEAAKDITADCLIARVRLLHRTMTSIYDDALRPLGLTSGQLNILVVVANHAPIAPGSVAKRLNMEKSTVSRNVARMVSNGWLCVGSAETRRAQLLSPSAEGGALLLEALPIWTAAQQKAEAVVGPDGVRCIHGLADSVWNELERS